MITVDSISHVKHYSACSYNTVRSTYGPHNVDSSLSTNVTDVCMYVQYYNHLL